MAKVNILECTLRDGSYPIDYQFTAEDTAVIAKALENIGFEYIEIGHGLGLNASNAGEGKAAEDDETYLKVAQEVLTKAKFGMFFIPGIGRMEDLDLAYRYEMDFVRIGTNVTVVEEAKEYIKKAKDYGMMVSSNLMKSYALPPAQFAQKAKIADEMDVDIVTLVDSAGGMLPKDVKEYIQSLKDQGISATLGFHGHNNLSLAIGNTITAINNGVTFVDSSMKGIGRSAGNAATEVLVVVLKKMGMEVNVDVFEVMDLAEKLIGPMYQVGRKDDSIALTLGYAEFHSKFLETVFKMSDIYKIDPRQLILRATEITKLNLPESLAKELAEELYSERNALSAISKLDIPSQKNLPREYWIQEIPNIEKLDMISSKIKSLSKKKGKQTIFTINISTRDVNFIFPYIQESSSYLMANSELASEKEIISTVEKIDGSVDYIILDDEKKNINLENLYDKVKKKAEKSILLTYKDNSMLSQGIDNFLASKLGSINKRKIGIIGINDIGIKLASLLSSRGAKVIFKSPLNEKVITKINNLNELKLNERQEDITLTDDNSIFSKNTDVLIGLDREILIDEEMVNNMNNNGFIVDGVIGSISEEAISLARKRKIFTWRMDYRAALAGEMTTVLRTYHMIKDIGRVKFGGEYIVSGGYIGEKGDIVVDSIENPTQIIGIADGKGHVLYTDDDRYTKKILAVRNEILRNKISFGKGRNKEQFNVRK